MLKSVIFAYFSFSNNLFLFFYLMVELYALVFLDLLYFTLCLICMIVWMAHHQSIMVGQFPFFLAH
jgi:hypothetical protein